MEPKPVSHIRPPAYPTRREVLAGSASLALVQLSGAGCSSDTATAGVILVAPIFEHGSGRGATGCVVVSPPVFLSEEEALQILREELAKHDIKLKDGGTLRGVEIPARTERNRWVDEGNGERELETTFVEVPDQAKPLQLHGLDPDQKIAVTFVSSESYFDLGGTMSGSTVQAFDFKDVASHVAAAARRQAQDQVFFGVFYEPSIALSLSEPVDGDDEEDGESGWKKREELAQRESQQLLRQQVQDFVGWLKEQQAIR